MGGKVNFKLKAVYKAAVCLLVLLGAMGAAAQSSASAPQHAHVFFRVKAVDSVGAPVSGRLLIFLKQGSGDKQVDNNEFNPSEVSIAAMEVRDLTPGETVEIDADQLAYPKAFATLPAGTYEAQAVLDLDHSYNYGGREATDWISDVVALPDWTPGASEPELVLDHHPEENPRRAEMMKQARERATPDVAQLEEFESPSLTAFWGKPTKIRAWVVLPPDYADNAAATWPTAYWTHGFGGNLEGALDYGLRLRALMNEKKMPPMIWVMLDESIAQGTHEFADSVNNGPWGTALTTEFIPYLEHKYRMDAKRDSRLLNGHSSGGWATLQLEVNYPKVFGGTWSTSPDPSDFHDFTGPDIYAAHANAYRRSDGSANPIFRDHGKVIATFEQLARMEQVIGSYGGQIASFEWVFSPKGASGAPEPMFNRTTGDVNPAVVAYWRDHYDLAHIVESTWAERGADLKGRIHVLVGTADTFYLDGPAHKFEAVLTKLGAEPHFTYIPDRTHFDLYVEGNDRMALFSRIGQEMWETARPGQNWRK